MKRRTLDETKREMNVKNLTKLRDLLVIDAAYEKGMKFDLGFLGSREVGASLFGWLLKGDDGKPGLSCHTTGCAMGLAAMSGAFPELKYHLTSGDASIKMVVKGERVTYLTAARATFGLRHYTAAILFQPDYYAVTRGAEAELEVVRRIDELLRVGAFDKTRLVRGTWDVPSSYWNYDELGRFTGLEATPFEKKPKTYAEVMKARGFRHDPVEGWVPEASDDLERYEGALEDRSRE